MSLEKKEYCYTPKENLRKNLTPKEFKDYEKMVEESMGIIFWEKLEEYTKFNDDWSLDWIYWGQQLDLTSSLFIKNLKYFKRIRGYLDLGWNEIEYLPDLENVEWDMIISKTPIKELPNLKYVWLNLVLNWIPINNLINILKEIDKNSTKIVWGIIYNWKDIKHYTNIYKFLDYLQDFGNEIIDDKILNDQKKEFINRYWIWRTKRDFSVKKELDGLANVFFCKFMENFLEEVEELNLMKNIWVSEKEIEIEWYKIDKKLEEKFHEIWHYFWEEIRNRLLDEFKKKMKEINQY